MGSTNTKPYLECPECGKVVMSLEQRIWWSMEMTYTCPYCECRYRVPVWCKSLQNVTAIVAGIILVIIYFVFRPPWSSWNVMDVVVVIVVTLFGGCVAKATGKKLAYIVPLEKTLWQKKRKDDSSNDP